MFIICLPFPDKHQEDTMQDTAAYVRVQAAAARNAYYAVSAADSSAKNAALLRTAELLDKHRTAILAANRQDMENAEAKGLGVR